MGTCSSITVLNMKILENLDTYFVTSVAAEYDGGCIVLNQFVDLEILDELLASNLPYAANTCGKTEVYTTNQSIKIHRPDQACINFISQDDLTEEGGDTESLYEYLFEGDYSEYGHCDCFGLHMSDPTPEANQALIEFISNPPTQAIANEYLRLKKVIFN
jgi:hypothetical protein